MATADGIDDDREPLVRGVLEVANALGERLTQLGDGSKLEPSQLLRELAEAQQELQIAWDLMRPEYSDLASIIDNQRADHWWQRKLIATLPMAVLETEPEGRIIWANNAAASMLNRPVLRLVRTQVQSFVHDDDQVAIDRLLTTIDWPSSADGHRAESVIRVKPEIGGTISVELVPTVRKERAGDRRVITWVIQPIQDTNGSGINDALVAHTFSQLCMLPLRSGSLQELLSEVARLCEDVCATNSSVSVTIGPPADPANLASSTEFAQRVDAAQMAAEEGPCQQAWESGAIVYSNDALGDSRWPRFGKAAGDLAIASALAAPIRVGDEILGVLNIYSRDADAFRASGMRVIELLAEAAGAVIHHVAEEEQLRELTAQLEEAMRSREVIEQAKGVLMSQYRCSSAEAFARLAKVSQDRNVRIREIAQALIDSLAGGAGGT